MRNTGINKKIEDMIREDLANLKLAVYDADRVWQYRDEHFLNGSQDSLFKKYIKEKKLKYKKSEESKKIKKCEYCGRNPVGPY